MTRDHRDLQELLGVYALDAVDPDEAAELEDHLRTCPQCRAELAEHRAVASLLANTGGPAPGPLWDRIAGALDDDGVAPDGADRDDVGRGGDAPPTVPPTAPAASPVTALDGARLARRRRPSAVAVALGAVAAAVVLVAGVVGVTTIRDQDRRLDDLTAQVAAGREDGAAAAAMADPSATVVRLVSPDGALTVPAVVTGDGQGYLLADALPDAGAGATYQLWGLEGTRAVSLGVLGPDPRVAPFRVERPVDTLALTTEEEGGVDQPTGDPVVAGSVVAADDTTRPS